MTVTCHIKDNVLSFQREGHMTRMKSEFYMVCRKAKLQVFVRCEQESEKSSDVFSLRVC